LWPKIHFNLRQRETYNGERDVRVIVEELKLNEKIFEAHKHLPLIDEENVLNACVKMLFVRPEGKKAMLWNEFVNGYLK